METKEDRKKRFEEINKNLLKLEKDFSKLVPELNKVLEDNLK